MKIKRYYRRNLRDLLTFHPCRHSDMVLPSMHVLSSPNFIGQLRFWVGKQNQNVGVRPTLVPPALAGRGTV